MPTEYIVPIDWTPEDNDIKVIGVGGGGVNAVTYMFNQKIHGCTFAVCNTDRQSLKSSDVPYKIQLGPGYGAGTDPSVARNYALDSQEEIEKFLEAQPKILFITAGMGGGTGTGASPVIAKIAKDKSILTVGVVTLPFTNEGPEAHAKACDGIREMEKYVDSLLLINNDNLYNFFGDELIQDGFPKTDEVLATAVRGIIEIIKKVGYINVDIRDVDTMMRSSGMALMGCGTGSGENRLEDAINETFNSPLLNDFDLTTSKNLLLNITVPRTEQGITMSELNEIDGLIMKKTGNVVKFKRGIMWNEDENAGDTVKITAIATGFKMDTSVLNADDNLRNIILIENDFEYKPEPGSSGIDWGEEVPLVYKIGRDTVENRRTFHFTEDNKPILLCSEGQNTESLRQTPAIRRQDIRNKN